MSEPGDVALAGRVASRQNRSFLLWIIPACALTLAAGVGVSQLLEGPQFIDSLEVENPTVYDIGIAVSDGNQDQWTPIGRARRGRTTTFRSLIDQGSTWTFRFSSQGRQAGVLTVDREQLERTDWQIVIPDDVAEALEVSGAPAPP